MSSPNTETSALPRYMQDTTVSARKLTVDRRGSRLSVTARTPRESKDARESHSEARALSIRERTDYSRLQKLCKAQATEIGLLRKENSNLKLALSKVNDNLFAKQRHDTSGPPPIQHKHLKKHAAAHALKSVPKPDSEPAKDAAKQTMTVGYEPVAVPNYMRPTKASQSDSVYSTVGVERNRSFSHSYQASWWC